MTVDTKRLNVLFQLPPDLVDRDQMADAYDAACVVLLEFDEELTRLRKDVTVLRAGVAEALRLLELGDAPNSADCRMNPGSAAELAGGVLRRIIKATDRSKTRTR